MTDFPDVDLPTADTWYSNVNIVAALIQQFITDPLNALARRLRDSDYDGSGIFTGANGCTIVNQEGRVIGNRGFVRVEYTLGSAAVTALGSVATNGDLANTAVLNIVDARFQPTGDFINQGLAGAGVGRVGTHVVQTSDNTVQLCAVAGSAAITAGDHFSFSGSYLLD